MNQEPNIIRYISILLEWKRFIVINFLIIALLSVGISLLLPNWYKSTASILPPKQQDLLGSAVGASSILKGLTGGKSLGSLGKSSGGYNYFAILKSRTSMVAVINKFDLIKVYDISDNNIDKAIKALEENAQFEMQDDDNITIEVFDKDPQRAADIANYFVEILNTTSIQLGTQEAKSNREFIGERLDQCREDLRVAEEAVKMFQEKKELIIVEDAKNSSISAYAELYATKAKKEIEIAVLERTVASDNQILRQFKAELNELSKKLSTFPGAGLEGMRLYREVVTQQKILEFLLPIYEQARIDEQKDVPVLLVIDKAVPAVKKSKPLRTIIVIIVSFVGLTFLIMMSFLLYGIGNMEEDNSPIIQKLKLWVNRIANFYRINRKELIA